MVSLLLFCLDTEAQVSGFTPTAIIGGIGQKLTINGSGFGTQRGTNYVSFYQESAAYMDTAKARALKYISWSDTKIEMEMPVAYSGKIKVNVGGVDKVSTDTLKVKANQGYRTANPLDYDYLNNTNAKGGYTWYMHSTYWNNPAAKAAIEEVFKEFRCKTGVNYILASQSSDAAFSLNDTINIIAPDAGLGVVGYTDRLWTSCIFGGVTFYSTKSMDIRMSTTQTWYFGTGAVPAGQAKFRYVLLHELGHSLGLGHVNEQGQTMYPTVTNLPSDTWSARDSITAEEKTAISYLVSLSQTFTFNSCGVSPLTPIVNCSNVYNPTTAVAEINRYQKAVIYPNPNNGIFAFKSDLNEPATISIYNNLGQLVYENTNFGNEEEINISEQPQGFYFLLLKAENETIRSVKINLLK